MTKQILAPLPGIFYRRPSPDEAPFKQPGDAVAAGETVGLVEAMKVVGSIDGISFIHFDEKDVVRHPLVQQIVKAYEAYGGSRQ